MPEYLTTNPAGQAQALHRQAKTMDRYQWVRELVFNVPVSGTEIRFSPDEIEDRDVIAIRDNGPGFEGRNSLGDDLRRHVKTLHESGPSGHDRYGLGGRVSTVPFNPAGVSFVSRRSPGDEAWVQIVESASGFHLKETRIDNENVSVFAPLPGMFYGFQHDSGTSVFLHGDGTVDYQAAEIMRYLRGRFFTLPGTLETVKVYDGQAWRQFKGIEGIVDDNTVDSGVVTVDDGVDAWWWLLEDEPTGDANWITGLNTIAVLNGDEIYNRPGHHVGLARRYSRFGITVPAIRRRVLILVDLTDNVDYWPNDGRTRIVTIEDHDLPWEEWGEVFMENMPDAIDELIEQAWTPESEERRQRIAKRIDPEFMKRMRQRPTLARADDGEPITIAEPLPSAGGDTGDGGNGNGNEPHRRARVRPRGEHRGRRKLQPDLPLIHWVDTPEWTAPEDDRGHGQHVGTIGYVLGADMWLHRQFFDIESHKVFWADRHPDVPRRVIDETVEYAVELYATAKYVYAQYYVAEHAQGDKLDRDVYMDAETFTVALGGIVDVDALIDDELTTKRKQTVD